MGTDIKFKPVATPVRATVVLDRYYEHAGKLYRGMHAMQVNVVRLVGPIGDAALVWRGNGLYGVTRAGQWEPCAAGRND